MFTLINNQKGDNMSEKNYVEKYAIEDKICNEKVAIVQPFLKNLSEQHDAGTAFYEDITVLSGPGQVEFNYFYKNRKDLFDRWQKGEVSIYNIKWAGVAFVIEYAKIHSIDRKTFANPVYKPANAFIVYKHREYPVDLDTATAVKDLHHAQEYRSILWGCMHRQNGM